MRKIIKWLTFGLVSVLSAGMFFGCGSTSNGNDSNSDSEQSSTVPPDSGPIVTEFTPTFRFIVASDMHVSASNADSQMTKIRFRDMFTQMNAYADGQSYDRLDAVLLAGDITDGGTNADLATAKQIIDANIAEETELVITMGNHDFWGNKSDPTAMIEQFEHKFGASNSHKVIGGYHFITLCADKSRAGDPGWDYSTTVVEYARTELEKAYAEVGDDKPIFVMQHVGNTNTCAGTCEHTNGNAVSTLDEIFSQYSNVVNFAGHSHFACNDECSIHQKNYTSIATGGLYYATRTTLNGSSIDMENRYEMAQNYVVEMDANNNMRVRCWDILQQKFVGETWMVESWDKENFVYTEDRFQDGDLFFADGATIELKETGAYSAKLAFNPVPETSLSARIYYVTVKDESGNLVCERYISNDYFNEPTAPIETEIAGLNPLIKYNVEVIALNSLYCSELNRYSTTVEDRMPVMESQPLTMSFTTQAKPPKAKDEVLAFDSADEIQSITATGATLSWVENANGVSGGLLKVRHEGTSTPVLKMNLQELCTSYKDYDWLVIRANFSNKLSGSMVDMNLCGKDDDYFKSWIYHNAWRNYVYKISSLTDAQVKDLQLQFKTTSNSTALGEFWIDEIYLMKDVSKADISVEVEGTQMEEENISFKLVNPSNAAIKQFIVKDPDGLVVEDLSSVVAKYGQYTATVTIVSGNQADDTRNALYYGGKDTEIIFKFTMAEAPKNLSVEFGEHVVTKSNGKTIVTLPTYKVMKNGVAFTPDSVAVSIKVKYADYAEVVVENNEFEAVLDGAIYNVEFAVKSGTKVERFNYEIKLDRPEQQAAHSIFDAKYAGDLENFYTDADSTVTWLDNFGYSRVEEETTGGDDNDIKMQGVVKVDYIGTDSPWFSFKPAQLMENYQDYDYIIFHIMCVGGANQINQIKPGAGSDCEYTGNGDHKTSWTYTGNTYFSVYAFKISAFLNAWTDGDINTATAKVQLLAAGKGAGTYYIAGIYAAKEISNANLGVTINGESSETAKVNAGDIISLAIANPEQYPYIDMTVTGPNGEEITNLSLFMAVAGTYTITFKHNPIGTTDSDKGYYYLRHDYGGCYSNGGQVKTVTIIIP